MDEAKSMRRGVLGLVRRAGTLGLAGCLLQAGCISDIQRELEVLLSPEANPTLIPGSVLVDLLGPGILQLFN